MKNKGKRENIGLENVEVIVELESNISNEMQVKPG